MVPAGSLAPGRRVRAAMLAFAAACALAPVEPARALAPIEERSAVIFAYGRFGDDAHPNTSIAPDLFEEHLRELASGGYVPMRLGDVVAALRAGTELPAGAVVVTIDQATRSAYREAWPRLKRAGIPFTLFVATDAVDRGGGDVMSWDELREVAAAGAEIGSLTGSYARLLDEAPEDVRAEIGRAQTRIMTELGTRPDLFAYPFGESDDGLRSILREFAIKGAVAGQSGVAGPNADLLALPRFFMNDAYGSLERFRMAASALPLAVSKIAPADGWLDDAPKAIVFSVDEAMGPLGDLACFASGYGAVPIALKDREARVTLPGPLDPGRLRINCTLPAGDGRWRWFGRIYAVPDQ